MDVDVVTATVKGEDPIDHSAGDLLTVVGGIARRPDVALSGSESVRAQKGDRGELDAMVVVDLEVMYAKRRLSLKPEPAEPASNNPV